MDKHEEEPTPFKGLIQRRMRELGIKTVEEFGERFDLARTTVYGLYSGRTSAYGKPIKPSLDTLVALSKALKMPLYRLVYLLEPNAPGARSIEEADGLLMGLELSPLDESSMLYHDDAGFPFQFSPIPTLFEAVPAGWFTVLEREDFSRETSYLGKLWVDEDLHKDRELAAFRIVGDSMEGGETPLSNFDIVIIDKNDRGKDGELVVIVLEDRNHLCRIKREDTFVCTNPGKRDPTPFAVPLNEASVEGRVVEVRRYVASDY